MRKWFRSALSPAVLMAIALGFVAIASAQGSSFKLRIAASKGKAAQNLPVFIGAEKAALGTTNALGELDLAFDASKNGKTFNVYQQACSEIVMLEAGTAEDERCAKDAVQAGATDDCKRCRRLGFFVFGRNATVGDFGSNTTRNVAIGAVVAAAAVGGAIAASGNDSNSSASTSTAPPFAGVSGTYQLNLTGNDGCPAFFPTAPVTVQLTVDPTTGIGTANVQYTGSRTDYGNVRAVREGNRVVITGSGAQVVTTVRNFTVDLRIVIELVTPGQAGQVREFTENFLQTTGPGSGCTQTFSFRS